MKRCPSTTRFCYTVYNSPKFNGFINWKRCPSTTRFCYTVYNSPKFNGFINCTLWSIIVVITLGKCAHRTPSGVRERHKCIGLI
jgi:hypothetical protein